MSQTLCEQYNLDPEKMPRHVAVIMDGNGRWAKQRDLPRHAGHREGIEAIERVVETITQLENVKVLTLYAFSTENWKRSSTEIKSIMSLVRFLPGKIAKLNQYKVKLCAMGCLENLSLFVRKAIGLTMDATKNNTGLVLNFAVNYGGREEILEGIKSVAKRQKEEGAFKSVDANTFTQHLYGEGLGDVDLLLRTSGDHRVSNFMLWHIPYAEMVFYSKLWPDMQQEDVIEAVREYQNRSRRFGNLKA